MIFLSFLRDESGLETVEIATLTALLLLAVVIAVRSIMVAVAARLDGTSQFLQELE